MSDDPKHQHTCSRPDEWNDVEPWEEHKWSCASPYCNKINRVCPKHGGDRPRME